MIAHINGEVVDKTVNALIVDVGGVGYEVQVSASDHEAARLGHQQKFFIYDHLRENSHDLFGFSDQATKQLFELLLTVSGVGPKMALNVLSIGGVVQLKTAIATGDVKYISQASGVGKRVAERVVVELKDKVGLAGADLGASGLLQSESVLRQDEAVEALASLGYSPQDAATALQSVPTDLPVEQRVRLALKTQR